MFLSVIVPTCNRYPALSRCLDALAPLRQGLAADAYEVIVTDDSSDEMTRLALAADFPWALWNQGPRRGPAANRNSGAARARGDWLVFVDDDCLPDATLLSAYQEAIRQNPSCLVFEGATRPERPRQRMDEEAPINETGGYLWSCNFMIQKELFASLGGFCELFPYAVLEDVDLRERLKQAGHSACFVPPASVIHPWRRLDPESKYWTSQVTSRSLFYQRHPGLRPTFSHRIGQLLRIWVAGLLVDGWRQRFRGGGRRLLRLLTITRMLLMPAASPAGKKTQVDG